MLFNFETLLTKEFDQFFALGQSLALALQFSQIESFQREAVKRFQSREYDTIRHFIDAYQSNLPQEIFQSPNYSFRAYLIPKIGNHASLSSIAIEFVRYDTTNPEVMEQYEKQIALIKERQIQVANQGKLKPSQVVERVKREFGEAFTSAHHTNAWKLYKVRPKVPRPEGCNTDFCQYDEPHKDFVYTEKWVQTLIEKVSDSQEFARIKSYREPK